MRDEYILAEYVGGNYYIIIVFEFWFEPDRILYEKMNVYNIIKMSWPELGLNTSGVNYSRDNYYTNNLLEPPGFIPVGSNYTKFNAQGVNEALTLSGPTLKFYMEEWDKFVIFPHVWS